MCLNLKALELLPTNTKINEIVNYLENVLEFQATNRRDNQLLKSMFFAENLQVIIKNFFNTVELKKLDVL